jgi:four helix bundle protein
MEKNEFVEMMTIRTKRLAIDTIDFADTFPNTQKYWIIGKQLMRSVTSVAANYRAVNRARSQAEFFAKMSIVVEECDETLFWLELLNEGNYMPSEKMTPLINEATELVKIFAKSRKNVTKDGK